MNLRLGLSICRIRSEMMKLIRGFLAYFLWIRWMEDVCRDVGDTDGHVGGPWDLEDVRKKRKSRHSVIFFEFAAGSADFFFAPSPPGGDTKGTSTGRQTSLEARGKLSTVLTTSPHPASRHKLAGSLTTHKKQSCDCLLA